MFLTMYVYHIGLNYIFVSFFIGKGVEHGLQFNIMRPFSRIGRIMEFIPGMDGLWWCHFLGLCLMGL